MVLLSLIILFTNIQLAAEAVDDARLESWGEKVIRFWGQPKCLLLMAYLSLVRDERFGALFVSTLASQYLPRSSSPSSVLADTHHLKSIAGKFISI
jgi:hypothetical protein